MFAIRVNRSGDCRISRIHKSSGGTPKHPTPSASASVSVSTHTQTQIESGVPETLRVTISSRVLTRPTKTLPSQAVLSSCRKEDERRETVREKERERKGERAGDETFFERMA